MADGSYELRPWGRVAPLVQLAVSSCSERIKAARAQARAVAWAAGADPGFYVIDFDGTLIDAHSDKQGAAPTYKGGFGFHPLMAYLDATGEALAGLLRPGNAGSGTAVDHVAVLDDSLAQLPIDPGEVEVIARSNPMPGRYEQTYPS